MTNNEFKSKIDLLNRIPSDGILELAKNSGIVIPNQFKIDELKKQVAEIVHIKNITSMYKEFEDAGNVTIHLFKFPITEKIKNKGSDELIQIFKSKKTSKGIKIDKIDKFDKNKIKLRIRSEGKEISEIDAKTNKLIEFNPLIQSLAIIDLNDGLVEVRTSDRKLAQLTASTIAKLFGDLKYEDISFDEDDLEKFISWAKTFRNATMKPLSGGISSLRMTASQNNDLGDETLYKDRDNLIGDSIRTGIYIQFEIDRQDVVRKIGFGINAADGKIFFRTKVREKEITHVLRQIKKIKKIGTEG